MSKIYELFGYPVDDDSREVAESRRMAYCPFMSGQCDGGGNRYMSEIDLLEYKELGKLFPGLERVPSGVCSIQFSERTPPWIICPRRLLYMGKDANDDVLHGRTQEILLKTCNFPKGIEVGIWSEVKVKYKDGDNDEEKSAFDYTFDYVLMPLDRVTQGQAVAASGVEWTVLPVFTTGLQGLPLLPCLQAEGQKLPRVRVQGWPPEGLAVCFQAGLDFFLFPSTKRFPLRVYLDNCCFREVSL